ncbi:MAG: hypothetical protein NZ529_06135 [Cytophagaceae bacterium]|nr:hypothetical protein [Cytophagaceae bacterium]MDW8456358.1 hypothetical protein [Cytophagaceae bacterium]
MCLTDFFKSLIILLSLFTLQVHAQINFYAGGALDVGVPVNHYEKKRSVIGARFPTSQYQGKVLLEFQCFDRIGLDFGISQNHQIWKMRDKDFASRNDGYVAKMNNKFYYYSLFGAILLFQPLNDYTSLYLRAGYSLNKIGAATMKDEKLYYKGNETLSLQSVYANENRSIHAEFGIRQLVYNDRDYYSVGLLVNIGQGNILSGSYSVSNNNELLQSDQFRSQGTFIGITARYGFRFAHVPKREKTPVVRNTTTNNRPTTPTNNLPSNINTTTTPKKIEGRDVEVKKQITVNKKTVTVKIWDHQEVDGDRISLNLNGRWILQDYTLTEKQKIITIELQPGKNIFVLHALNLGRLSPNTAAMIIDDGIHQEKLILESTLTTSGTIEIFYVP